MAENLPKLDSTAEMQEQSAGGPSKNIKIKPGWNKSKTPAAPKTPVAPAQVTPAPVTPQVAPVTPQVTPQVGPQVTPAPVTPQVAQVVPAPVTPQVAQVVPAPVTQEKTRFIQQFTEEEIKKLFFPQEKNTFTTEIDREWSFIRNHILQCCVYGDNTRLINYGKNLIAFYKNKIKEVEKIIEKKNSDTVKNIIGDINIQQQQLKSLGNILTTDDTIMSMNSENQKAIKDKFLGTIGDNTTEVMKDDYADRLKTVKYRMLIDEYQKRIEDIDICMTSLDPTQTFNDLEEYEQANDNDEEFSKEIHGLFDTLPDDDGTFAFNQDYDYDASKYQGGGGRHQKGGLPNDYQVLFPLDTLQFCMDSKIDMYKYKLDFNAISDSIFTNQPFMVEYVYFMSSIQYALANPDVLLDSNFFNFNEINGLLYDFKTQHNILEPEEETNEQAMFVGGKQTYQTGGKSNGELYNAEIRACFQQIFKVAGKPKINIQEIKSAPCITTLFNSETWKNFSDMDIIQIKDYLQVRTGIWTEVKDTDINYDLEVSFINQLFATFNDYTTINSFFRSNVKIDESFKKFIGWWEDQLNVIPGPYDSDSIFIEKFIELAKHRVIYWYLDQNIKTENYNDEQITELIDKFEQLKPFTTGATGYYLIDNYIEDCIFFLIGKMRVKPQRERKIYAPPPTPGQTPTPTTTTTTTGKTPGQPPPNSSSSNFRTITNPQGLTYTGPVNSNGQPNGLGELTYPDGNKFYGNFINGNIGDRGTMTFPDGRKYKGEFKDNTINGNGKMTYPDKVMYEGEFKNGAANGLGTARYANLDSYEGQFVNGQKSGHGKTKIFATGQTYEGEFLNNLPNGQGILKDSNGKTIYDGLWNNGNPVNPPGNKSETLPECIEPQSSSGPEREFLDFFKDYINSTTEHRNQVFAQYVNHFMDESTPNYRKSVITFIKEIQNTCLTESNREEKDILEDILKKLIDAAKASNTAEGNSYTALIEEPTLPVQSSGGFYEFNTEIIAYIDKLIDYNEMLAQPMIGLVNPSQPGASETNSKIAEGSKNNTTEKQNNIKFLSILSTIFSNQKTETNSIIKQSIPEFNSNLSEKDEEENTEDDDFSFEPPIENNTELSNQIVTNNISELIQNIEKDGNPEFVQKSKANLELIKNKINSINNGENIPEAFDAQYRDIDNPTVFDIKDLFLKLKGDFNKGDSDNPKFLEGYILERLDEYIKTQEKIEGKNNKPVKIPVSQLVNDVKTVESLNQAIFTTDSKIKEMKIAVDNNQRQERRIEGATGSNASKINGIYEFTDEVSGEMPIYLKKGDPDMWLMFNSAEKDWNVQSTDIKGTDQSLAYLKCDPPCLPEMGPNGTWKVLTNESTWEPQASMDISNVDGSNSRESPVATKEQINSAVNELDRLKNEYKTMTKRDWDPSSVATPVTPVTPVNPLNPVTPVTPVNPLNPVTPVVTPAVDPYALVKEEDDETLKILNKELQDLEAKIPPIDESISKTQTSISSIEKDYDALNKKSEKTDEDWNHLTSLQSEKNLLRRQLIDFTNQKRIIKSSQAGINRKILSKNWI